MTTAPEIPAAERAEFDLDHHSTEFRDRPHEITDEIRSRCPVAHSPQHGGFWVFTDYQSVADASRDDDLFSSAETVGVPESGMPFPILPIETDPPETQDLRAITLPAFSRKSSRDLEPAMREIATELIDTFIEKGTADLVQELTTPLPARMMLRMLGFDESRWSEWVDRVHAVIHDRAHDADTSMMAGASILNELAAEMDLRRDRPADSDLFARIVHGEVQGEPLDQVQITMYGFLMMLGGMDTTSGLTSNALVSMANRPELRSALIEDRGLMTQATEEFLRVDTPTLALARTVTRDAEFHGQHLKQGDRVLLMWGAANRDPQVFPHPGTIDFERENKKHLSFGVGMHRCLGSNLARDMFAVMIDEILTRLPDFELDGEPVRFDDAAEVYAVRHLPVRFTPGPRRGTS
ncbi:MAG TPA: cytochrome P450 [Marmoricola sp.]|jgi:cytochrome P450|nr:cytochrome P450 [Marmoricola sp.]